MLLSNHEVFISQRVKLGKSPLFDWHVHWMVDDGRCGLHDGCQAFACHRAGLFVVFFHVWFICLVTFGQCGLSVLAALRVVFTHSLRVSLLTLVWFPADLQ